MLTDKDWRGVMGALAPVVDVFVLTTRPPRRRAARGTSTKRCALRAVARLGSGARAGLRSRRIDAASSLAATVLVTGSFHTVGDAMARLQVDPLAG